MLNCVNIGESSLVSTSKSAPEVINGLPLFVLGLLLLRERGFDEAISIEAQLDHRD